MALPLTLPVILLFIEFVVAIILVYFGSEWVVDSASAMALYLGVSSAFIGLTLISVGTSIPEIAVSTTAAFKGYGGVSGGNIIGSDLVQITLILGICAFIRPIFMERSEVRQDGIIMLAAATIGILAMLTGTCAHTLQCEAGPGTFNCVDRSGEFTSNLGYTEASGKARLVMGLDMHDEELTVVCEGDDPPGQDIPFNNDTMCIPEKISVIENDMDTDSCTCKKVFGNDGDMTITCKNVMVRYDTELDGTTGSAEVTYLDPNTQQLSKVNATCTSNAASATFDTGCVTRFEGLGLALLYICYVIYLYNHSTPPDEIKKSKITREKAVVLMISGFVFVVVGSNMLVRTSVNLAIMFGVPAFIIGMTMVGFGTSLPELIISAMAAYKGEEEMSLGNLVGSNITDPLFSIGFGAFMGGNIIVNSGLVRSNGLYMLFCSAVAVAIMWRTGRVGRKAAFLMSGLYFVYLYFLF